MPHIVYIGPELIFSFKKSALLNTYEVVIKANETQLKGMVLFERIDTNPPTKLECTMSIGIDSVVGNMVSPETLSKAMNCLTINSKQAGQVCCQAFLNGFLDSEF